MKFKKDEKLHIHRLEKNEIIVAFKVMGNEYRMNMLLSLQNNSGISLDQINGLVGGEFKNISTHMKKLHQAGLVFKKYKGKHVQHSLTEYGKRAIFAFNLFSKDLNI